MASLIGAAMLGGCSAESEGGRPDPQRAGTLPPAIPGPATHATGQGPTGPIPQSTREGPVSELAPPGVDPRMVHDLTHGANLRMLGMWGATVVFASSDPRGRTVVQGKSPVTGEEVWARTLDPELGSASQPSQMTIQLQYDAVTVLETSRVDRLDKIARLTVLDPDTGITKVHQRITKYKADGTFEPFGILIEPWDRPLAVHLVDGRVITLPDDRVDWMLVTPRGGKPWVGREGVWPSAPSNDTELGLDQITPERAVRRHRVTEDQVGLEVIDTGARRSLGSGCSGGVDGSAPLVVSPHRTWAALGSATIELRTGTVLCDRSLADRAGRILAIGDDGLRFGIAAPSARGVAYFIAARGREPRILEDGGAQSVAASAFDPERPDLAHTVAVSGDRLVVAGRVFQLPEDS